MVSIYNNWKGEIKKGQEIKKNLKNYAKLIRPIALKGKALLNVS